MRARAAGQQRKPGCARPATVGRADAGHVREITRRWRRALRVLALGRDPDDVPGQAEPLHAAITSAEGSSSQRRRPCTAERGKAWWLWCQDSPSEGSASQKTLVELVVHVEAARAEEVADRVDAPGDVVDEEDPHQAAPEQAGERAGQVPVSSEAERARGARGRATTRATKRRLMKRMPGPRRGPARIVFQSARPVLDEQPAGVRVPEPAQHAADPSPWPTCGLCGSPSTSVWAWCLRWSATQAITGPCTAIEPSTAKAYSSGLRSGRSGG